MIGKNKKMMKRTFLIGSLLALLLSAGVLIGCSGETQHNEAGNTAAAAAQQAGGESAGEHGAGGESSGSEGGGESAGSGSEEASGATLAPDATFDAVRGGARLILNYDAASNAFQGTVENTTNNTLGRVRIEVHLSNGTELGPTTPVDLAPGQVIDVNLPSTQASFTGWIAHAEVGSGAEGSASGGEGGESGPDGPEGPESGGAGSEAAREAAMSSPVTPLDQTWNGVLGGLAVSAWYDANTQTVHSTIQNTLPQTQCFVQAEPHLKSGNTTVGELGPDQLGDLNPGQQTTSSVSVSSEPNLAGVSFDGYVVHLEVFDCGGPGPMPHTGGESGGSEGAGGEGHGPGGEGGSESGGSGSEEGSSATMAPDATYDAVRGGARLILNYDAASNAFQGTVQNTTGGVLTNVRIEVHLSNGTELGPTVPVDMAPGQVLLVNLPSTQEPFTGWIAHAEVGGGEGGGEHGSSGEHGSGGQSGGGEHGSGGGGEHGSRSEGNSGG